MSSGDNSQQLADLETSLDDINILASLLATKNNFECRKEDISTLNKAFMEDEEPTTQSVDQIFSPETLKIIEDNKN
jgi:hypothetical protein